METLSQTKVAQWNEFFLSCVVRANLAPTVTARTMQILHTAIYDAWAAFDPVALGLHSRIDAPATLTTAQNFTSAVEEAIGYAAFTAAKALFPTQTEQLRAFMSGMGYNPDAAASDPATASAIGKNAAQAVLTYRASDFSNAANGYADTTGYVAVNSAIPGAANAPGGDVVTLGEGNDRIEGYSAALDNLVVRDFAAGDRIVLLDNVDPTRVIASAATGGVLLTFGAYDIKLEGSFAPGQFVASLQGSDTVIAVTQTGALASNLGETFSLAADTSARLTLARELANSISTSAVL